MLLTCYSKLKYNVSFATNIKTMNVNIHDTSYLGFAISCLILHGQGLRIKPSFDKNTFYVTYLCWQ